MRERAQRLRQRLAEALGPVGRPVGRVLGWVSGLGWSVLALAVVALLVGRRLGWVELMVVAVACATLFVLCCLLVAGRTRLQVVAEVSPHRVSVGEADFTKAMMKKLGDVAFWKIAMRPGRPMAVGRIPGSGPGQASAVLFGLPGNPVAVMVTFLAFVRPALLRMMGSAAAVGRRAVLSRIPRADRRTVVATWRNAVPGQPFELQHHLLCADGRMRVVHQPNPPIRSRSNRFCAATSRWSTVKSSAGNDSIAIARAGSRTGRNPADRPPS